MLYQPLTKVGRGGGKVLVPAHRSTEAPKQVSPARLQSRPRAAQKEGAKNRQPPPKPRLARFPRFENESSAVIFGGFSIFVPWLRGWATDSASVQPGASVPASRVYGGRAGRAAPSVPRARLIRWSGPRAARSSASSLASGGGDERRKRFPPRPGRVPGWPEW